MKKYILPLISIAMLMAMASCSSSDDAVEEIKEESKLVPMTFTATQESNAETRSALNNRNGVDWQAGDEISVFDGTGAGCNHQFSLTGDASLGKFSGIASSEATSFTAVYPYTEGATLGEDGSVSGITLPAEQTATPNSFDPKAALMMAYTTDKSKLDFKNAVSLVKITTDFDCKSIVLTAKENIAGTGTLSYNNGKPSIAFDTNESQTITLKPASENGVIAAGTYYIAISPHTSSGFSIRFINSADTKAYTRTSTKNNIFNRSGIRNLGTFKELDDTWTSTIESNGNVKASQQVDLGLTIEQDGKKYRVIFAKSNLTANGLADDETDYGDYFAWGATKPWYTSYSGGRIEESELIGGKSGGYIPANAPYYNISTKKYTKYTDGNTLDASDDAAHVILGGAWQLPTTEIWGALYNANQNKVYWGPNNGDETLETISGIQGMKITKIDDSKTYIFLPAAGYVTGYVFTDVGSIFYYWSGTASSTGAYDLTFWKGRVTAQDSSYRQFGYSVRPVRLVEE